MFSDKLDGLRTGAKRKRDWEAIASRMEDYLQLPDDYDTRASEPGKKRVINFPMAYHLYVTVSGKEVFISKHSVSYQYSSFT